MAAEALPNWPGMGPDYTAWLNSLERTPSSPEAALGSTTPGRAYLAMMNGEQEFSVLHSVHRWTAAEGGRRSLHNRIVAFEGEVMPWYNVPLLYRFEEDDATLLQLEELPTTAPSHAAEFYRDGERDNSFICAPSRPRRTIQATPSRWAVALSQFRWDGPRFFLTIRQWARHFGV